MILVLIAGAIALGVAYILTPIVGRVATRWGVVAQPGGRRIHERPTPMMGGLAMYIGFIVAVMTVVLLKPGTPLSERAIGILVAGSIVAIVGLLDDKFELPGWVQALSIVISAAVMAQFGVTVYYVNNPLTHKLLVLSPILGVLVTAIWMLMVTKAVDCMDGLDGLAGGICAIAACTLMLMALADGRRMMSAVMAAALFGGIIGFLRYNYPPAKIFMGTIGSQFLGFMLGGIAILGAFKITTFLAVAVPILVMAVPLFDTTFVVLKRAATGKKIHEADTSHLHHRLSGKGFSNEQVIWVIYGLTFLFCAAAYILFRIMKAG